MEGLFEQLPTWGILVLGVVYLAFQFVQKVLDRQGQKREERARKEYRERRGRATMVSLDGGPIRPEKSRPSEDTGRHDLRSVLEDEREREQRLEIVSNTRQHAEMMGRLVAAEGSQTQLLQRLVDMQERQDKMMQQLADTQQAIVRYLAGSVGGHAATLRNLDPVVVREDGGG